MTAHTLTGTATDALTADDTDGLVVNSTAAADPRVVTRSLLGNRINWDSATSTTVQGPTFSDVLAENPAGIGAIAAPPAPLTVSQIFSVLIGCRFTGCRIYKAPNAVGTDIPVTLWSTTPTSAPAFDVGTELATTTIDWVVDAGGWRQVTFPAPVDLDPDLTYVLGYWAPDGIYAWSPWIFNAQDTVAWPIVARAIFEASGVKTRGNAVLTDATDIIFPTIHTGSGYYIDPQVEWDDPMPGYTGGTTYHDQWTTPHTRHAFPLAVFFADPPYLADYYDLGVNTLVAGSPSGGSGNAAEYVAAMNAMGNTMDWWPHLGPNSPAALVQLQTDEPDIADQIVGYQLWDEPDMSGTFRTPTVMRGWVNGMRQIDSTKPILFGFGIWPVRNQGFGWSPSGASPYLVNDYWREWATCTDIMACDDYTMSDGYDPNSRYGIWTYATQVGRMRELCDDTKPVWITVETTSPTPGQPSPDNSRKAIWAALIAGARGIILFDHRFGSDFVTQDFAAMLSDAPMSAMVSALATQLQTLGPALLAADLGLVTASTSSNTTAGPKGGTYGVPIHYTSRSDGTYQYVFAQAIRPGATTATLTIPAWAGLTVTVLDESRNETVSGGGVLTDSFAADYQVHLYRRTL